MIIEKGSTGPAASAPQHSRPSRGSFAPRVWVSPGRRWGLRLVLLAGGGGLFLVGCLRDFQREVEVLFAPEAVGPAIRQSWIFNQLGPGFIKFWQAFW